MIIDHIYKINIDKEKLLVDRNNKIGETMNP